MNKNYIWQIEVKRYNEKKWKPFCGIFYERFTKLYPITSSYGNRSLARKQAKYMTENNTMNIALGKSYIKYRVVKYIRSEK